MQKFRQHPPKSRFNNYFLNAPAKNRKDLRMHTEPSPTAATAKTALDQNTDPSAFLEISSKMSIRSSRQRERSGRVERKEAINRQITKNTLRRMRRLNTQQRDGDQGKQMALLKRCVNEMNIVCNEVKKADSLPLHAHSRVENYAREERRKFLMGQVCFTEIDQARILSQQHYLRQFEHLRASLPKMLQTSIAHSQKVHQGHILACLRWIDRLYVALQQMQFAGFQIRNNRFLIEYCLTARMWLKRVFLTESEDKKDAFSMTVKYYAVASVDKAKANFTTYLAGGPSVGIATCLSDLENLYDHLQASLTQKKLSKLINITSGLDITASSTAKELKCLKRASEDSLIQGRLTQDLQQMESQFGPMREITRISRRKFDQLNRTYGRLQCLL